MRWVISDSTGVFSCLAATSYIHWGSCGLSGEIRVNASFVDGFSCSGVLSDWNPRSCSSRSKIVLALENCKTKRKEGNRSPPLFRANYSSPTTTPTLRASLGMSFPRQFLERLLLTSQLWSRAVLALIYFYYKLFIILW